jgi:hypothetical protein
MVERNADPELVKVTIRLPRGLVQQAKLYAVALDYDLQDLVATVLRDYLAREPIPASLTHMLRRRPAKKGGK